MGLFGLKWAKLQLGLSFKMILRFTYWVKQLLFSGLDWIPAPSYLSGGLMGGWVDGLVELRSKLTQPTIGVGAELGNRSKIDNILSETTHTTNQECILAQPYSAQALIQSSLKLLSHKPKYIFLFIQQPHKWSNKPNYPLFNSKSHSPSANTRF